MKARQNIIAYCFDKRGRLISTGRNSYVRTHPLQKHFAEKVGHHGKEFIHAEIDAILKAKGKQINSIHIVRLDSKGKARLAKPCPICMEAIQAFGIVNTTWST